MSDAHEPGSPGVIGEDPNRAEPDTEVGALDENPDGRTPDESTDSGIDSLPPGSG